MDSADHVLDLLGEHFFSAGVDRRAVPAEQRERAVGLVLDAIAGNGIQNAVDLAERAVGLFGIPQVPARDGTTLGKPAQFRITWVEPAAEILGNNGEVRPR